jgi:hypothetical protein
VNPKANRDFWACFDRLPRSAQTIARQKYRLWLNDPFHPSLHFKELTPGIWSARISDNLRAMARRRGELVVWFWIGAHDEYDRLIGKG